MEWNEETAKALKAHGMGFGEISRTLGVSYYMVRSRLDPVWLEHRRQQINAARETTHSLGKRDHVHHVRPEPAESEEVDAGPFTTPSGIRAYRKHVPNRVSLTSSPVNESIATKAISLPFVSILRMGVRA